MATARHLRVRLGVGILIMLCSGLLSMVVAQPVEPPVMPMGDLPPVSVDTMPSPPSPEASLPTNQPPSTEPQASSSALPATAAPMAPDPSAAAPLPPASSPETAMPPSNNPVSSPPPSVSPPIAPGTTSPAVATAEAKGEKQPDYRRPGWRPRASTKTIPSNPFGGSTIITVASPVAFKAEFEALSKDIRGILQIGNRDAIVIGSQVVKEGDGVRLVSGYSKPQALKTGATSETSAASKDRRDVGNAPVAVFAGLKKNESVARFLVGDTEVAVPLPSNKKNLEASKFSITSYYRAGTATIISPNGMFVIASHLVPDPGSYDYIKVRTQYGSYQAKIVEKNESNGLALGMISSFPQIELPSTQHIEGMDLASGSLLGFDPSDQQASMRPKWFSISRTQPNPTWLAGCPMFMGQEWVGILALKEGNLTLLSLEEIQESFQKFEQKPKKDSENSEPKLIKAGTVERIVALVNVHEQETPTNTKAGEGDESEEGS